MGLYLCAFDGDEELEGVEIGSYADFNFFRDAVVAAVENGQPGTACPVLINHSDCDGEWSPSEAAALLAELKLIEEKLREYPPAEYNSPWKKEIAKTFGIAPKSLLECFFDVDGEPLTGRLRGLAETSVRNDVPISFQ
jgi:Immunity protein 70